MNTKEIFTKAIQKAVAGGFDLNKAEGSRYPNDSFRKHTDPRFYGKQTQDYGADMVYWLIFNHDFAKALWGEDEAGVEDFYSPKHNELSGSYWPEMWEYRLQQMVIADDPIHYLGSNI